MMGRSLALFAVVLVLLLASCSYTWVKVDAEASNIRWQVTDIATLQTMPGCEAAIACAISFPSINICVILATTKIEDTPAFIVEHEKKHCEGFAHK